MMAYSGVVSVSRLERDLSHGVGGTGEDARLSRDQLRDSRPDQDRVQIRHVAPRSCLDRLG